MNKEDTPNINSSKYLGELKMYCNKLKPFVTYYSKLIKSYNNTVYDIIENRIKPVLPIHLNISSTSFDSSLHSRPSRLKDFVHKHMQDNAQEIFDLQKGIHHMHHYLTKISS